MTGFKFSERRYKTRLKYLSGLPELTALVDLFFLSLLIFVLARNFERFSGISVDLPRITPRTTVPLELFVVSLTPSDAESGSKVRIYYRDRYCEKFDDLLDKLNEQHKKSPRSSVIIRADRTIPFEEVARVMDAAKNAGLACFIALEAPKPEAEPAVAYEK